MKKRKTGKRILSIIIAFVMLLSSMTVLAVERPSKNAGTPTWGDVWAIQEYVGEQIYSLTEEEGGNELSFEDDPAGEAAYRKSGLKMVAVSLETAYAADCSERYFNNPPEDAEDSTELTGDQASNYSTLYDAGMAMVDGIVIATGTKYIDDIVSDYDGFWDNYDTPLRNRIDAGQIVVVDIANDEVAPDITTMDQGTYWVDLADMETYDNAVAAQESTQNSWEWEGHNGGPDILRTEMQGVISALTSAYNTLISKLHEGTKVTAVPAEDLKPAENLKMVSKSSSSSKQEEETAPVLVNEVLFSTGTKKQSSIEGVYGQTFVAGTIFNDEQAKIRQAAGLSEEEIKGGVAIKYYICNSINKKINEKLSDVVTGQGYKVLGIMNCDLYKLNKGEIAKIKTTAEALTVTIGVPEKLRNEKYEFVVMCYDEGGNLVTMQDLDTDKNTITVQTNSFGQWAIGYKAK